MDTGVEHITRVMAIEYLNTNKHNRTMAPGHVNDIVHILRNGDWHLTPDAIAFDEDGVLLNGQHRLEAIRITGITAECLVVRGMTAEAFMVIDRGMKRTAGQVLHVLGYKYAKSSAAGARLIVSRDQQSSVQHADHQAIIRYVAENREAFEFASELATKHPMVGIQMASVVAFLVMGILSEADTDLMEQYVVGISSGENLVKGDVRLAVRNWYINAAKLRLNSMTTLANLIRGFNRYAMGELVTHIKTWRPGAEFPEFHDA
jgi:hypothetical protein